MRGRGSSTETAPPAPARRAATKEPTEPCPTTSHWSRRLAIAALTPHLQGRPRDPPDDLLDVRVLLLQVRDGAAVEQDDDPVADLVHLRDVVAHEHHRNPAAADLADQLRDLLLLLDAERRRPRPSAGSAGPTRPH